MGQDVVEDEVVSAVRSFVDRDVRGHVRDLEHDDVYPEAWIGQMKQLGIYGLLVPEEHGGVHVSARCFAKVSEELARGWMSLSGAMGGHSVIVTLIRDHGTKAQKQRYLPKLATGEIRAAMALTEAGGGSDLQAMRTSATRGDGGYRLRGSKTWITNAQRAGLIAVLLKTDSEAARPADGMSIVLMESGDGYEVSRPFGKLGYRGVESCEVVFDDVTVPRDRLLGDSEGEGFAQMMRALELGRVQVAARAVGVAQAAYEDSLEYAQQRTAFGRPIWKHQAIGHYLSDMAMQVSAARALTLEAAAKFDSGERSDLEAGMAKVFASEVAARVTLDALRIHAAHGYSTEADVERYFRDAPLMIIGEGTNEIQKNVIVKELVRRNPSPTTAVPDGGR